MFIAFQHGNATVLRSRNTGKSYIVEPMSGGVCCHADRLTIFGKSRRQIMGLIEAADKI